MPMGGMMPGAAPAAVVPEVSPGWGPEQKGMFLWCPVPILPHVIWPDFSQSSSWTCISQLTLRMCVLLPVGSPSASQDLLPARMCGSLPTGDRVSSGGKQTIIQMRGKR